MSLGDINHTDLAKSHHVDRRNANKMARFGPSDNLSSESENSKDDRRKYLSHFLIFIFCLLAIYVLKSSMGKNFQGNIEM